MRGRAAAYTLRTGGGSSRCHNRHAFLALVGARAPHCKGADLRTAGSRRCRFVRSATRRRSRSRAPSRRRSPPSRSRASGATRTAPLVATATMTSWPTSSPRLNWNSAHAKSARGRSSSASTPAKPKPWTRPKKNVTTTRRTGKIGSTLSSAARTIVAAIAGSMNAGVSETSFERRQAERDRVRDRERRDDADHRPHGLRQPLDRLPARAAFCASPTAGAGRAGRGRGRSR